ncbi:MAG: hypothetical protein GY940_08330 [bacterium]|nr:hypothetical protein [bacterium]
MKTKPLNKKLSLKKITVANLDDLSMAQIHGGLAQAEEGYIIQKFLSLYTNCRNGSCNTGCVHGSCFMECTPSELCPTVEPVAL